MAWNVRAGVSNYDMLKPDKYKDGYSTDHLGINWGSTTMDANDRENLLWSKMKAGPNNDDPYPRPPFDPIQLALVCYQTCKDLSSPS